MESGSALTYDVTIEPAGDRFRITWRDVKTKEKKSFIGNLSISEEEVSTSWEKSPNRLTIGQALFHFLDGGKDDRLFSQALDRASELKKKLRINLRTCEETTDWPFELLARNNKFLLIKHVHLIRRVSDRGKLKEGFPQTRPLRILFMASSPKGLPGKLDYVREEEAMLRITEKFPIEVGIEDSGSLKGLQRRLVRKYYDIVHLSGHANFDEKGPFLYMEDETGEITRIHPEKLYNDALIENLPRFLFLSGCRTGETKNEAEDKPAISFARQMVEGYYIPAVLGWGRSVWDSQANLAGKTIYNELSRGRTIPEAVQQARHEMQKEFFGHYEPAWPSLRLNCDGTPLHGIVNKEQPREPPPQQMNYVYLPHSRVKVLKEGFVGRRRQLQISMQALSSDLDKVGILLLGTGGLGKSCLAGKIAERFGGHTPVVVQGTLNADTMKAALEKAFNDSRDNEGKQILSQNKEMADALADLCAASFKEKNYLLLMDGLEQNQGKVTNGQPGLLKPEAEKLLDTLLYYLPFCGKMTHLVITSRYSFTLTLKRQDRDLVQERLQKIWLTGFNDDEQLRHLFNLKNIHDKKNASLWEQLIKTGFGNPLLLEKIDELAGTIPVNESTRLHEKIEKTHKDFLLELGLEQIYRDCSMPLKCILERLSVYPGPVPEDNIKRNEPEITKFEQWRDMLREGMDIGLVEYDQVNLTYNLTHLLKEKLKEELNAKKKNNRYGFFYADGLK